MSYNEAMTSEKHENYIVEITDLDAHGNGVGKNDANPLVTFVEGALPEETWLVTTKRELSSYRIATPLQCLKTSPDRIESTCSSFVRCGGCQMRHLTYEAQLKIKRQHVVDALERIGHIPNAADLVVPTIPCLEPDASRGKVLLPFGTVDGQLEIGFFERGTHTIVPFAECHSIPEIANKIVLSLRQFLRTADIPAYDETTGEGILRHLLVRLSPITNHVMVALVVAKRLENKGFWQRLTQLLQATITPPHQLIAVYETLNQTRTNTVLTNDHVCHYGTTLFQDEILGCRLTALPHTFLQVNTIQANQLAQIVVDLAAVTPNQCVLDLYCGAGSFTLPFAKLAKHVDGIEINPESIRLATQNAKQNGITNVSFTSAKVEAWLTPEHIKKYDLVVVDPPRSGLFASVAEHFSQLKIPKLIYISCNPATLARDLSILRETYKIKTVIPVDMFSMTMHVETVVLMSKLKD